MKNSTIFFFSLIFLSSCDGISKNGHAHYMMDDCKCVEFPGMGNEVYIPNKGGWVQGCARKIGDSLKWGFIIDNDSCSTFLPFIYDEVGDFSGGLATVKKGNLWGVIDTTGKIIIDYKYHNLRDFSDSLAAFTDDSKKYGFISTKGDTVIKQTLLYATDFFADISLTQTDQFKWIVLNSKGNTLPIKVDSLEKNYSYIAHGYMGSIHKEFFDNPIYSNGQKIRLVAFNKRYVLLPDTTDTRLIMIGQNKVPEELLRNTFK
jgi:WG containing repeat